MKQRIRRSFTVVAMALTVLAFSAVAAFAQTTPVELIIDEAQTIVSTNVPLIAGGLAVLLGVALGIRALWTAYANAKRGVSQMK